MLFLNAVEFRNGTVVDIPCKMLSLLKTMKAFYNKTYMNYTYGDVDPLKFYVNLYYFARAFQVLDNEAKPKWTYCTAVIIAFLGTLAAVLCATSVYHGVQIRHLSYSTEFISYLILMVYKLLTLYSVKLNTLHFHVFLRELRADFKYVCNEGARYRTRYFENQLLTWKLSLLAGIFTAAIGVGLVSFGILALSVYLYTHEPGNREHRPLPFQFWFFDVDFQLTPIFEVFFVFGCFFVMSHIFMVTFSIPAGIIWVREITSKADLVVWSIQDLLDGVHPMINEEEKRRLTHILKERMRDILIKHQSIYTLLSSYSDVYQKILMYEQKLSGPVICLSAYCIAETLDKGQLDGNSVLVFISITVVYFIPSYMCTFLSEKIESVCDACWDIPFWKAGPLMKVLRPYLVLIMQKSLRPLILQAPGFEEISIQTYSKHMAAAYSWFNMIRQSNI